MQYFSLVMRIISCNPATCPIQFTHYSIPPQTVIRTFYIVQRYLLFHHPTIIFTGAVILFDLKARVFHHYVTFCRNPFCCFLQVARHMLLTRYGETRVRKKCGNLCSKIRPKKLFFLPTNLFLHRVREGYLSR